MSVYAWMTKLTIPTFLSGVGPITFTPSIDRNAASACLQSARSWRSMSLKPTSLM